MCGFQLAVELRGIALISKLELILQIVEAGINRGSREHQDFCANTLADDFFEQGNITIILAVVVSVELTTISEVVRLVYNNEVVCIPTQA